jgi:hypothetical protein
MGDCGEEELLFDQQGLVFMIYQQMVDKQTGRILLNELSWSIQAS